LPAKRESGVPRCSIAKLRRCEMLSNGSKTALDVLSIQLELRASRVKASERDRDVRTPVRVSTSMAAVGTFLPVPKFGSNIDANGRRAETGFVGFVSS